MKWNSRQILCLIGSLAAVALCDTHELCDRFAVATEGNYTYNNNVWNDDGSGRVCTFVEKSNPSNSFYSDWEWSSRPPLVHAFPHVEYHNARLPLPIENVSTLHFKLAWDVRPTSLETSVGEADIQASVAVDLFADLDADKSKEPSKQGYEIMIWLAQFGTASEPLGQSRGNQLLSKQMIGDNEFTLYNGTNGSGQNVYSWVLSDGQMIKALDADVAPLIHYLAALELIPWTTYLGVVQFGTETFYSDEEIRFSVDNFETQITLGERPVVEIIEAPGDEESSAENSMCRTYGWSVAAAAWVLLV